jgi:hypothetical protein
MAKAASQRQAASWRRFRRRLEQHPPATRSDYESLQIGAWPSLEVIMGARQPRHLWLFTKPFLVNRWVEQQEFPQDVVALVHYGLPSRNQLAFVADLTRRWKLPLGVVGDLDPLDLTVFLVLRAGDPELRFRTRARRDVSWLGIDDQWLDLCRKSQRRSSPEGPAVRMTRPLEREHWQAVKGMMPEAGQVVGAACLELLEQGWKVELEGASNPVSYRPGFLRLLRNHLLARYRRQRRAPGR